MENEKETEITLCIPSCMTAAVLAAVVDAVISGELPDCENCPADEGFDGYAL